MLNDAITWPRIAQVIGKSAQNDVHQLLITDVQTTDHGDYVVTVELPPFGFTREHAAYMAHAARHASPMVLDVLTACQRCGEGGLTNGDTHCGFCAHMVRAEIAARIAALLPPE